MLNTYNESSLHNSLKNIYCDQYSKKEQKIDNWICDIVTKDGNIIEIQTKNVSKLYKKVNDLLQKGKRVTIVHPIIAEKHILTLAENADKEISRRKSPKKESIYSLFKELTGLYPILLNKNFTLIVPEIHITEIRIKTKEPMQLQNKSRHYLKNWIIVDKQLDKIIAINEFTKANDYLKLLPNHLPKEFSCPLVYKLIKEQIPTPRILQQNIRIMFWVFEKTGLISFIKKSGRKKLYKKIDTEVSV